MDLIFVIVIDEVYYMYVVGIFLLDVFALPISFDFYYLDCCFLVS